MRVRRLLPWVVLCVLGVPGSAAAKGPDVAISISDPSVVPEAPLDRGDRGPWAWVSGAGYGVTVRGDNAGRADVARGVTVRAVGAGLRRGSVRVGRLRPADDFSVRLPVTLRRESATLRVEVRNRRDRLLAARTVRLLTKPAPPAPATGSWTGTVAGAPGQPARTVSFTVADGGRVEDFTGQLTGLATICTPADRRTVEHRYPAVTVPRSNVVQRSDTAVRLPRTFSLRFTDAATAVGSLRLHRGACVIGIDFEARLLGSPNADAE